MKQSITLVVAVLILVVAALGKAYAQETSEEHNGPFVKVNMMLELDGIETSVKHIQGSFSSISESLHLIATSDKLPVEQQELLTETVNNLNQLISVSRDSVQALPVAKQAVQESSESFFANLKFNIMLVIIAIAAIIVATIICIYLLILKPMQSTLVQATANISDMAAAIKVTAQALESSTDKQQQIWKELEPAKAE